MADAWLQRKQKISENAAMNTMIDVMINNTKSSHHKNTLRNIKDKLKYNGATPLEENKEIAMDRWAFYKCPSMDIAGAVDKRNKHFEQRHMDQRVQRLMHPRSAPPLPEPIREAFVQVGEIYYAIDPETGNVERDTPLENPNKFSLQDVDDFAHVTPFSKNVDTIRFLELLLEFGGWLSYNICLDLSLICLFFVVSILPHNIL